MYCRYVQTVIHKLPNLILKCMKSKEKLNQTFIFKHRKGSRKLVTRTT